MDGRFEICNHLKEHKESKPTGRVSIEVGELRDLVEVIRVETINLRGNIDEKEQALFRFEMLYKQLTGQETNKGFWEIDND